MKRVLIIIVATMICVASRAQEKPQEEVRYNQYGVKVDRNPLGVEERSGILVFESKSQDYRLWFDIRVQADGAVYFGENKDFDKIGDGVSIRRARFAVKGQITKDWYGELDTDFANGSFELKDAILVYSGLRNFEFTAGNFKEGFSMECTTTSRYLALLERPMVVQTFGPSRHIGLQAKYNYKWLMAAGGIHFQAIEGQETRTYVEDNNKDYGRSSGNSYTGKLVIMPFYDKQNYGLHFGAAASYRLPKSDVDPADYNGSRYSTRNATSINRKKYLDTDVIDGTDHDVLYGIEFAGFRKGFRFQSEYIGNDTYIKESSTLANKETKHFNGWYAQAGILLFGGKQQYNVQDGEFTQPTRGKSWGDIELVGRYDYLNLNSNGIFGGSGENYTFGINYYINHSVKMMLNYMYSNNDRYANGKGKLYVGYDIDGNRTKDPTKVADASGKAGVDFHMLGIRFEIDF